MFSKEICFRYKEEIEFFSTGFTYVLINAPVLQGTLVPLAGTKLAFTVAQRSSCLNCRKLRGSTVCFHTAQTIVFNQRNYMYFNNRWSWLLNL